MMRAKHKLLYLVLLPLFLILLLVMFFKFRSSAPVVFAKVKKGNIIEAVYGIGTITPRKIYNVKVNSAGTIGKLFVEEGDLVKKGDKLLTFEGILFYAPFAGTITALPFKAGETVFPQVPLLTLRDQRDLYVVVSLEQQGALRVQPGQIAYMSFDSMRDKRFQGRVKAIFSNESQFIVHIDVETFPPEILPGMTADVGIQIGEKKDVWIVPVSTLNGEKLKTVKKNRMVEIPVKIGVVDSDMAEVISDQIDENTELTLGSTVKK